MRVRGTQLKVSEIEVNIDTVYIRSNITRIEDENFSGWEYDEEQINKNEYIASIAKESGIMQAQNISLVEANENLKIEQAQANSEMIELMMSMLGGTL